MGGGTLRKFAAARKLKADEGPSHAKIFGQSLPCRNTQLSDVGYAVALLTGLENASRRHFVSGYRPAHRGAPVAHSARQLEEKMVLPVRIELTTSALPRMRSTTELRQHSARAAGSGPRGERPFCAGAAHCQGAALRFIALL